MKKKYLLIAVLFLAVSNLFAADEKNIVTAALKSVVVYRTGAELTHTAKVNLKQGNNDLMIEGLSNDLDINSVQIGCEGKVTIMSVEFSTDYLKPVVKSAIVKRLEDSVEIINKELSGITVMLNTDKELIELLKANKEIRGTQTGLSVAELMKMMDYYKAKTLEVQNEISKYRERENKLHESQEKIKLQVEEEEQKNNQKGGKLLLQLLNPLAGTFDLTISYMTLRAYWNPYYDIRVENISKPLNLMYKAKLVQTTGIEWKKVKLSLATTTPNQQNNAPLLKSWFLSYVNPITRLENNLYMNSIPSVLNGRLAGLDEYKKLNETVVTGYGTTGVKHRGINTDNNAPTALYVVNGEVVTAEEFQNIDPNNIKSVEVLKDANATSIYGAKASNGAIVVTLKGDLGDYITVRESELNVTFDIDIPYDVPGNGKEQSVELKEYPVNGVFKYYAVPKLDKDAYLLCEISDWEQLNLLPGEANIIFEGTYIGKTFIDPRSTMDTLNLTLGKDKRIVVKREKLKDFSSVKFLGSNKKQIITYELTVKNNKKEAIQLQLKDQYPLSTNKEIEVELLESTGASNNTELGVLTWTLQLDPGESKKLRMSYSIKYPKEKFINL